MVDLNEWKWMAACAYKRLSSQIENKSHAKPMRRSESCNLSTRSNHKTKLTASRRDLVWNGREKLYNSQSNIKHRMSRHYFQPVPVVIVQIKHGYRVLRNPFMNRCSHQYWPSSTLSNIGERNGCSGVSSTDRCMCGVQLKELFRAARPRRQVDSVCVSMRWEGNKNAIAPSSLLSKRPSPSIHTLIHQHSPTIQSDSRVSMQFLLCNTAVGNQCTSLTLLSSGAQENDGLGGWESGRKGHAGVQHRKRERERALERLSFFRVRLFRREMRHFTCACAPKLFLLNETLQFYAHIECGKGKMVLVLFIACQSLIINDLI